MKLWRIDLHLRQIENHEITDGCDPQYVEQYPYGVLFRCHTKRHDVYGFKLRKEAKAEALLLVQKEMGRLSTLLKHLENKSAEDNT